MLGHRPRRAGAPSTSAVASRAAALTASAVLVLAAPAALAQPTPQPGPGQYAPAGARVEGGSSIAQAPLLEPGVSLDVLEKGGTQQDRMGTSKYYRVDVAEGQVLHAAATIAAPPYGRPVPSPAQDLSADLEIVGSGGADCTSESPTVNGESGSGDGPITTQLASAPAGEECPAGSMFLKVTRSGLRAAGTALPVEIQVSLEKAGAVTGSPVRSDPIEDTGADPVAPASDDPLDPGRSLAAPTEVEPGSYVLELAPGDSDVLAIPVAAGQRLRWRTEIVSDPGESPGSVSLTVVDPARELVTVRGGTESIGDRGSVRGGGMVAPIAPGNRQSDDDAIATAWLPGRHSVVVHRLQRTEFDHQFGGDAGDEPIRMILTLEVEGKADDSVRTADLVELGDVSAGGFFSGVLGRVAALGGAAVLGLIAAASGVGGVVLLRRR